MKYFILAALTALSLTSVATSYAAPLGMREVSRNGSDEKSKIYGRCLDNGAKPRGCCTMIGETIPRNNGSIPHCFVKLESSD